MQKTRKSEKKKISIIWWKNLFAIHTLEGVIFQAGLPWWKREFAIDFDAFEGDVLSFERRHASAHDLVDEQEIRRDHRARVHLLHFHSVGWKRKNVKTTEYPFLHYYTIT